jgi:hypothetical protein
MDMRLRLLTNKVNKCFVKNRIQWEWSGSGLASSTFARRRRRAVELARDPLSLAQSLTKL